MPWKDLSLDEQHELISKDSFPEDMRLLDPSKLQRCDVEALWQHWTRRQKANARPLIFYASAAVNIRRAKARPSQPKKARRVEVRGCGGRTCIGVVEQRAKGPRSVAEGHGLWSARLRASLYC